jgi:hypothetical protein
MHFRLQFGMANAIFHLKINDFFSSDQLKFRTQFTVASNDLQAVTDGCADDAEHIAWRPLAAIRHGRSSLLVLTCAARFTFPGATNDSLAVSSVRTYNGSIGRAVSHRRVHCGRKRAHAVRLTPCQTASAIKADTRLTPTSTTKLITSAATALRLRTSRLLPCRLSPVGPSSAVNRRLAR